MVGIIIQFFLIITRTLQALVLVYCMAAMLIKPYDKLYIYLVKFSRYMDKILNPFRKLTDPITIRTGIDIAPVIAVMVFQTIFRIIVVIVYFIFR